MEQWEYLTRFFEAKANDKEIKRFIRETFDKKPRPHSPEALIPELNRLGAEGWELVHMEPVPRLGRKEDVQHAPYHWSGVYFCVFKRRRGVQTVLPLNADGQPAFRAGAEGAQVRPQAAAPQTSEPQPPTPTAEQQSAPVQRSGPPIPPELG